MANIMGGVTTTPLAIKMIKGKIIDQTYNPKSENAQSGKAVAEAVANAGSVDLSNYYTKAEVDNLDAVKYVIQDDETSVSLNSPVGNSYILVNDNGDVDISSEENVRINGSRITLVGNPKENTDAATKGYVDGLVGDIETLLGGI